MKYRFIEEQRGAHSVERVARLVGVSRSGYYAWRVRPRSGREKANEDLAKAIGEIQKEHKWRYGSPRVTRELWQRGQRVGGNRVARVMRERGLWARRKRRYRSTTDSNHSLPVAQNLLRRKFEVRGMDTAWVSDISYISTAQGWLYLCVVMDLGSRKIVGWSMSRRMKAELVVSALQMAVMRRGPGRGLIFHSDRGSQYCSGDVRKCLENAGMRQSMSRKADPWDNAPAESLFKTLKSELMGDRAFRTREEAREALFEYIEVYYNRRRLHSALGYRTPEEYEASMATRLAS
jgi:transposase InsO family protein